MSPTGLLEAGGNGEAEMASAKKPPRSARGLAIAFVFATITGLAGCASSDAAKKALNPDPPGKMYAEADSLLSAGRFDEAATKFEDLDRDHPYAPEARRAMVLAAWSYYKAGKSPEAIAAARRYTTMHPGTKDAALAHHVIASSYFADIKDPHHDQSAARRAMAELKILASRYPDSPYAKQADNRIRICEDNIAANEMIVGRYYLNKKNYVAAINRFKVVVAEFQTTQHIEEALYRLAEANLALGIAPEAQTAIAILGHNYPQSSWYKSGYAILQKDGLNPQTSSDSWIVQQWKKIVPGSKPQPAPKPTPVAEPDPRMETPPAVDPVPPARVPAQDIPTASTTRSKPMGLTRAN